MKNIRVVIGANYGDEGKGHIVDYLAHQNNYRELVIRFNGGAQAGHTVETESTRHVFSHFGSGTLVSSPTYLSQFFVCNPVLFVKELKELRTNGYLTQVYVAPNCMVTIPYDVMINQFIEKYRESLGQLVHGSCGVGFNETIQRDEKNFTLRVSDLRDKDKLVKIINQIKTVYVPARYAELTGTKFEAEMPDITDKFLEDCETFLKYTEIVDTNVMDKYENLIFEGAQGLCLDQNYGTFMGWFPHITHSNTGLKNVVKLIDSNNFLQDILINTIYVTRPYLTRHGAGPLSDELLEKPSGIAIDKTNSTNEFQGKLRYAWLDLDELKHRIEFDMLYAYKLPCTKNIALTCLNQIDESNLFVIEDNELHHIKDKLDFSSWIEGWLDPVNMIYLSNGPMRESISY